MTIQHNVIKDLIPSYIDSLTSPESNQLIEEHLKTCESCRAYYESMKESMVVNQDQELKKIEPLKKIKRVNRRKIFFSVVITALVLISIYIGVALYTKSFMANSSDISEAIIHQNGTVALDFSDSTNRDHIYTLALLEPDSDLEDGYQPVVKIKQARSFFTDASLQEAGTISFVFASPDSIYLQNEAGIIYKLTEQDTLTIQYEDKEETIKISELYDNSQ
ncbi:zf-HC2 domain-containing protein [Enterococcus sp. HY326]|uniref:zf-HC2 domain-containing protein n=1 Tax=Enterococcus sp. HY326 TaxID=2971265 RepID=UPI0022404007|nr:zf-HC2 domain-containing protein [Enterococcus sp. HY326]